MIKPKWFGELIKQYLEKIICSLKIEIKDSILFLILIILTHNS